MYLVAITWKANSGGIEDDPRSIGSISDVDELFKSRIMPVFDNIRLLGRSLSGMGTRMLYYSFKADVKIYLVHLASRLICIKLSA